MKTTLVIVNFIALIGAIIWWLTTTGLEPIITTLTLLSTFLAQIFTNGELKSKIEMIQKSNKNSYNYQAVGDQNNINQKTLQKGGDGSQQFSADQMTVTVGIDEKRAREIYQEMNTQLKEDYSQEAFNIANKRVIEFENRLMPKMEEVDGALEAFSDPSFQLLLVEAQKSAASTERPEDYDLLSELLLHRFQKGESRTARAGIGRAVEVVDKIDDDALIGLTVSHALSTFLPTTGDYRRGLNTLNNLFGKLFYANLPTGNDWLDHLEILDAVRISSFGKLKNLQQFYPEILSGYIDVGIEKDSEDHNKALEILKTNNIPQEILAQHTFNDNHLRLQVVNKKSIDLTQILKKSPSDGNVLATSLSTAQKDALHSIYELYKKDNSLRNENIALLMKEWDKMPHLKTLREWWDNIGTSFQITSVGKVLAHSNAQRCDKHLPPLD